MTVQQQIEMGKRYRTRNGLYVVILNVSHDETHYPVQARVYYPDGGRVETYTEDGYYRQVKIRDDLDLIEVEVHTQPPRKRRTFVNPDYKDPTLITFVNPDYKDPTLISMDKKYRTRGGQAVRVLAVDVNHPTYAVVAVIAETDGTETISKYTNDGYYYPGRSDVDDLIEISPFEDMKIDDPVIVTIGSQGSVGKVFHFAGTTEDGRPKVWAQGRTSLTVKNKACDWWIPAGLKPYVAE